MQVREVVVGAGGAVQRLHVRDELDQVAGRESRGESEVTEDLHQQPAGVSARAAGALKCLVGFLHTRLHADEVADLALQLVVQPHKQVDGLLARPNRRAEPLEPCGEPRPDGRRLEEGDQLLRERRRVAERVMFGIGLDEEIEWIDHTHVGRQVDDDVERRGGLGEDEPCDPVAVRVLLPVEEIRVRRDVQRVAEDQRTAVRRRAQPDLVRRECDRPVESVRCAVMQRDADGHQDQSGFGSSEKTRRKPSPHSLCTIWKYGSLSSIRRCMRTDSASAS